MVKVTDITRPRVGMYVRVRHGAGPRAGQVSTGRVVWSDEGAWTLEGSTHIYRKDRGDKLVWMSSKPSKDKAGEGAQVVAFPEHARVRKERDRAVWCMRVLAWLLTIETALVLAAVSLWRGG